MKTELCISVLDNTIKRFKPVPSQALLLIQIEEYNIAATTTNNF